MALRTIFEVCDEDTVYEVGGRLRETWWGQMAARKHLSATLKDILALSSVRCWKFSSRGGSGGDRDAEES